MNKKLPIEILIAQEKGIKYFSGEDYQWKLEIENHTKHIEKLAGCPILIFADNGHGDKLFLKKNPNDDSFGGEVYVFFHDGPEILGVNERLDVLLGLKDRMPSKGDYPKPIYETGEDVQIGDKVKINVWAEFWKGWQDGMVTYVPGISNKNPQFEHGGLKWVAIKIKNGQICPLVDNENGKLKKVRFIGRG